MSPHLDSQLIYCLRGGTIVSEDPPTIFSPPAQTVDLNQVPLGRIAEEHADRVTELVERATASDKPRRSQFGSSI